MTVEKPIERRFVFDGSAVAFAARIRRPENVFVRAAAPTHLPVTGGLSEAKLEGDETKPYHYKDVITFSAAHSRSRGDFLDPTKARDFTHGNHSEHKLHARTKVESSLDDLRIDAPLDPQHNTPRRIFHAKKLDVCMESTSDRKSVVSFGSLTATFDGISLTTFSDGGSSTVELKVLLETQLFNDNDTKATLMARYANDEDFRRQYGPCFHPPGAKIAEILSHMVGGHHRIQRSDCGPITATFVTGLEWVGGPPPAGTEILNNRLTIAGLGKIYFGEIIIDEGSRRVSLLRFELGSGHGGDATANEIQSKGGEVPPLDPP